MENFERPFSFTPSNRKNYVCQGGRDVKEHENIIQKSLLLMSAKAQNVQNLTKSNSNCKFIQKKYVQVYTYIIVVVIQ